MRWTVHGEYPLYTNRWVNLRLVEVELPDGQRFSHHAVRVGPSAGTVVVVDKRVLLLWRHRFITDTWGFEIPAGKAEEDEPPDRAAAREVEEETGWRPGPLRSLLYLQPTPGITDSRHYVFTADSARWIGPPTDTTEAERVVWVPLAEVRTLIDQQRLVSGSTMAALLYVLSSQFSSQNEEK